MRNQLASAREEALNLYTQHCQPEMRGGHNRSTSKVTRRRNLPAGVVVIMRAIA